MDIKTHLVEHEVLDIKGIGELDTRYVLKSRNLSVSAPITGGGELSADRTFGFDTTTTSLTKYLLLTGGTLTGDLSMAAGLSTKWLQGANGTAGKFISIHGDYNNFYLTNPDGKVVVEKASDESHALFIQEPNSPYQGVGWWFDGSGSTGTGVWMASAPNAGDINLKINGTGGVYGVLVKDSSSIAVISLMSDGKSSFTNDMTLKLALNILQQANGTAGHYVSLRADYNNMYLHNSDGKVVFENASDENHAAFIQEPNNPWQGVGWWFDGSGSTGTGTWMSGGSNAANINLKINGTAGSFGFYVKNSSSVAQFAVLNNGNIGFFGVTPATRQTHIIDADGTLTDITTKFNALLVKLENYGLLATS